MAQPQTGNIEEFPPLGGLGSGADGGQDRRTGLIQNAAFGGGGAGQAGRFGGSITQSRVGLTSPDDQDRGSMRLGGQRIPSEDVGRNGGPRTGFLGQQQPIGPPLAQDQGFGGGGGQDGGAQQPQGTRQKRLTDMSEFERWALPGLLAMIPAESPDHSSLAIGQDLTALGLDLNRPDNSPLYPTFGVPFGDPNNNGMLRPVIPDFSLPPSYSVTNVSPLHTKMQSFSDDTLFAIFYQYPRDIMQEHAAAELYSRDWRWHKELRQWMMKDLHSAPPQQLNSKQERGAYVFFDVNNWRRERVSSHVLLRQT